MGATELNVPRVVFFLEYFSWALLGIVRSIVEKWGGAMMGPVVVGPGAHLDRRKPLRFYDGHEKLHLALYRNVRSIVFFAALLSKGRV